MEKEKREVRKSQTATKKFFFLLSLFLQKNLYFVRKHIWKKLVYIVTFILLFLA